MDRDLTDDFVFTRIHLSPSFSLISLTTHISPDLFINLPSLSSDSSTCQRLGFRSQIQIHNLQQKSNPMENTVQEVCDSIISLHTKVTNNGRPNFWFQ
ncbi:hypothetical protein HanPI659440_Chr03g0121581 [Helianthus annuus]|nr:hypothetical protein HanPI659440_Chr03g0121581 [Helianthus annuus]